MRVCVCGGGGTFSIRWGGGGGGGTFSIPSQDSLVFWPLQSNFTLVLSGAEYVIFQNY